MAWECLEVKLHQHSRHNPHAFDRPAETSKVFLQQEWADPASTLMDSLVQLSPVW